jgi:methionine synthase I (cobalamin-dependent)/5,10-methylenetetrahydrofolate reductase
MSRTKRFLEQLPTQVLVCDGAMGTELYNRGVSFDQSFDSLCLTQPDLVQSVHQDYKAAGAQILLTNTFGSNRYRLKAHGLDEQATAINEMAAQLARNAAGDDCYVAGSVGPIGKRLKPVGQVAVEEAEAAFSEQMSALASGGVDLFFLETFSDLAEIKAAMRAASRVASEIPVVAHMTFNDDGKTLHGYKPEEVAQVLTTMGAVAVGANCSVGPQPIMDVVERMLRVPNVRLSIQPNAGLPQYHHGRFVYVCSPEYMADYARQFVQNGTHIVGGCCGTGPEHIRQIRDAVDGLRPSRPVSGVGIEASEPDMVELDPASVVSAGNGESLRVKLEAGQFVSSVEIDPPKGINVEKLVRGAELCRQSGVDCINIADSPLARARMSPMALANIIRREVDIEIILHMSCRDRNVIGLQSDIMGAYVQGVRNILCVTGDPPHVGDYPSATGVFDVDAIGLATLCTHLNKGLDLAGRKINYKTRIFTGVASNPTSDELETEFRRFGDKMAAGAHFTMTQPLYELDSLKRFLDECQPTIPVLIGILPLRNARHARFIHNEVPGMFIPQGIRDRMGQAGEDGPQEGVRIAREFLAEAKSHVQGVYLMPPFNHFWMATEVIKGIV